MLDAATTEVARPYQSTISPASSEEALTEGFVLLSGANPVVLRLLFGHLRDVFSPFSVFPSPDTHTVPLH